MKHSIFRILAVSLLAVMASCSTPLPVWDPPNPPVVDPIPQPPVVDPTPITDPAVVPELAPARALRDAVQAGSAKTQADVMADLGVPPRSKYTEIEGLKRYVERFYIPSRSQAGVEYGVYVYYDRVGGIAVDVDTE